MTGPGAKLCHRKDSVGRSSLHTGSYGSNDSNQVRGACHGRRAGVAIFRAGRRHAQAGVASYSSTVNPLVQYAAHIEWRTTISQ